jgi:ATP-dependent RNA helicase DDX52/ROK1
MDELFNLLSSSARIDKSKRRKKPKPIESTIATLPKSVNTFEGSNGDGKKKEHSESKKIQIHQEQINAFRNKMLIHLSQSNRHDPLTPDPISSFDEISLPKWWKDEKVNIFKGLKATIIRNIEGGKWINPTPIQMQVIPTLLNRRDCLGCAATGSGKSGAFLIPTLFLASVPDFIFYNREQPKINKRESSTGKIRALLLAPSRELAVQLHREVQRLGEGKVHGLKAVLLSKSNSKTIADSTGKKGMDVLVSTPLRLMECLENPDEKGKSLDLGSVRIVVLDEADRLLDASDGTDQRKSNSVSGSAHMKTFLAQIDTILSKVPTTAVRALFSATIGSEVRHLSESILRNQIDITTGAKIGNSTASGVNDNISQSLQFVGREEGKLLAIRQIVTKGLHPPVIIFLQSKDRAQALYLELLYDNIHVDVIHAGKSQGARDKAVAKFRKGETWVLICTDLCARGLDFKAVNMVINYDLPTSGVTYVHRIGRCGRAGRKGTAITLFTEADFEHLRNIANVMKHGGCDVPEWMLSVKKNRGLPGAHKKVRNRRMPVKRGRIDTTPSYDKKKTAKRKQAIEHHKMAKKNKGDSHNDTA